RNDSILNGQNTINLTARIQGDYQVKVSNGTCTKAGNKIFIRVNQLPAVPVITQNKHVLSSTAAAQYQWYKDGVAISGAIAQSYTASQSGIYKVSITDANGCTNTSADFNFIYVGIAL